MWHNPREKGLPMSETTPDYITKRDWGRVWECCNCRHKLATIIYGEAWVQKVDVVFSDAAPLVLCPACGAGNMWPPEA